jgi:FKBP-type peptidyl-prolyl cis-trans isomerase
MLIFKRLGLVLVTAVLLSSCLGKYVESDLDKSYKENETQILAYASTNGITLSQDTQSSIYYQKLTKNDAGTQVSSKYDLRVAYKLSTLAGKVIETKTAADSVVLNLYTTKVLDGFLYSILLLKEKEKGQFFIPSYLAYYDTPPAGVEKYEVIVLELEVLGLISEEEKIDSYISKNKLVVSKKTDTGLRFIRTNAATSADSLKTGDVLSVNYNGMFLNNISFDSGTLSVTLGTTSLIPGFIEGLKLMKKGEKAKVIMPSSLGYTDKGSGKIPPYTPLIFDLEIVSVNGL